MALLTGSMLFHLKGNYRTIFNSITYKCETILGQAWAPKVSSDALYISSQTYPKTDSQINLNDISFNKYLQTLYICQALF